MSGRRSKERVDGAAPAKAKPKAKGASRASGTRTPAAKAAKTANAGAKSPPAPLKVGKGERFSATLFQPAGAAAATPRPPHPADAPRKAVSGGWTFLILPKEASAKLPSRGQVTVDGALNGVPFRATLEPDGRGGHWLKVDRKLREAAGAEAGDVVTLEISPVAPHEEPEPKAPADLRKALAAAPKKVREVWSDITPIARRDWIQWIVSAKQAETRARRIGNACSMLAAGKRRPCCFDRSGMYGKGLSCPVPTPAPTPPTSPTTSDTTGSRRHRGG